MLTSTSGGGGGGDVRFRPLTNHFCDVHSDDVGWSKITNFTTPPAVGANSVRVVMYGDMGKAERENASIHYSAVPTQEYFLHFENILWYCFVK